MKRLGRGAALAAAALALSASAAPPQKPQLELRAAPPVSLPGTSVLFVAELKGGADDESLYCPTLVWEWTIQETNVVEEACPPWQAGVTPVERRFTLSRTFPTEGERQVTLSLRKDGRVLARATAKFRIAFKKGLLRVHGAGER